MAITERLALLVTLDAQGAVKGFNDLGKAADRNLGKTDQRLDQFASRFQKAGAGMLAGAALAGAGLFKAGQSASDLGEAVSQSQQIFGDAARSIEDFSKGAASSFGQSQRAAAEAANTFGLLFTNAGKSADEAAGMSIELTKLASDMASFKNTSPEEAVAALGSALRGESEPIRLYGVMLDEATLKQRAMDMGLIQTTTGTLPPAIKMQAAYAEILAQTSTLQGDFGRTSDGLANQQRRLAAEFENMKTSIGGAVAPVLADIASGLSSVVGRFNELPVGVQSAISKTATYGTIAAGAVGATALLGGKVLEARDSFARMSTELPRTSRALAGVGRAAATLGPLLALDQVAPLSFFNDSVPGIEEMENALVRLATGRAIDSLDVDLDKLGRAIERVGDPSVATQINDTVDNLATLGGALDFGKNSDLDEAKAQIDALDKALAQLATRNPELAGQALSVIADEHGVSVSSLLDLLDDYEGALAGVDTAAATTGSAAAAGVDRVTEAVDRQKTAIDLAKESMDAFKTGVQDAFGPLDLQAATDQRASAIGAIGERFVEAQEAVKDAKQRVADLLAIPVDDRSDTFGRDLAAAQADVQSAIGETSRALEGNSETALQNREDLRGVVDDIGAIIQKHRDEGASLEELKRIRDLEKLGLIDQLEQLGFNREEIGEYIAAIDAIPITKATTITADVAAAISDVERLKAHLAGLSDTSGVGVSIDTEKLAQRAQVNDTSLAIPAAGTPTVLPSAPTTHFNNVTIINPTPEPVSTTIRSVRFNNALVGG